MSIMRTKGNGKVIITSTPKGDGGFYDLYKMGKRITIENYNKDDGMMVIWGWDVLQSDESEELYSFQLQHRTHTEMRIYITLSRVLQYAPSPYYPEMMYQCYITDDDGMWEDRSWFRAWDLSYKNFWAIVEDVIERRVGVLD